MDYNVYVKLVTMKKLKMKNEYNEYFVPDIEDFRFGYEFEKNYSSSGDGWYPTKIVAYLDFEGLDFYIQEGLLRTSYLTKEQIEAEG